MSATPVRSRSPAMSAPPRGARGSTTRTSRPNRRAHWGVLHAQKPLQNNSSWLLVRGRGLGWSGAAAAGCSRSGAKMAEAIDLAALHTPAVVDRALGQAATAGRFGHGDLAAILAHQAGDANTPAITDPTRAGDHNSLA